MEVERAIVAEEMLDASPRGIFSISWGSRR
jgi:hypothetical protein